MVHDCWSSLVTFALGAMLIHAFRFRVGASMYVCDPVACCMRYYAKQLWLVTMGKQYYRQATHCGQVTYCGRVTPLAIGHHCGQPLAMAPLTHTVHLSAWARKVLSRVERWVHGIVHVLYMHSALSCMGDEQSLAHSFFVTMLSKVIR